MNALAASGYDKTIEGAKQYPAGRKGPPSNSESCWDESGDSYKTRGSVLESWRWRQKVAQSRAPQTAVEHFLIEHVAKTSHVRMGVIRRSIVTRHGARQH